MNPIIVEGGKHPIRPEQLSPEARKVLFRLKNSGFLAYLAGGCVRDLYLGRQPKDFDVVTDATPKRVKRIFRNCRLIGRRFRLAHIFFKGGETIEVATFRSFTKNIGNLNSKHIKERNGLILRDNLFGTPEEDALRRDFTINSLFYNIADGSVIDFTGGLQDLKKRQIRSLGDPDTRYVEDPVRMLRAIRFVSSLNLSIEKETFDAITRNRMQLENVSNARLFEELMKILYSGGAQKAVELLNTTELLEVFLPEWGKWYKSYANKDELNWVNAVLQQFDNWKEKDIFRDPALLLILLFYSYCVSKKKKEQPALKAVVETIPILQRTLSPRVQISQRDTLRMLKIVKNMPEFRKQNPNWANHLAARGHFLNSFLFFTFHAQYYSEQLELLAWWREHLPHKSKRKRIKRKHGNIFQHKKPAKTMPSRKSQKKT